MDNKSVGVLFAGSGALYPIYIGALHGLKDLGFEIKALAGTSGGAIAATFWSHFCDTHSKEESLDLIKKTLPSKNKNIVKYSIRSLWDLCFKGGLLDTKNLEEHFRAVFREKLSDVGIPLYIFCAKKKCDKPHCFSSKEHKDHSLPAVLASSCSIPYIFQPVSLQDKGQYYDGGWAYRLPTQVFSEDFPKLPVLAFRIVKSGDGFIKTKIMNLLRNILYRKIFKNLFVNKYGWKENTTVCNLESIYCGTKIGGISEEEAEGMFYEGYRQCQKILKEK